MMVNKEYGSDFHLCLEEDFIHQGRENNPGNLFSFFFSGRSAIHSILGAGIRDFGWQKVYFPSYYCHDVVQYLLDLPIVIHYYPYNPFLDNHDKIIGVADEDGAVIVNVAFFGMRHLNFNNYKKAVIIEDLTHDYFGFENSTADYCFGSLRKQFPLPCGGFCFSPAGKKLPVPGYTAESDAVAFQKATAMFLKREYLEGRFRDKNIVRSQFGAAEGMFGNSATNGQMPGVARSMFARLKKRKILDAKRENLKRGLSLLGERTKCYLDKEFANENSFGFFFRLNSYDEQQQLKSYLISNNIYPSVLWPNQKTERDVETERSVLFIHADYRYNVDDMRYITGTLNRYFS